MRRIFLLFALWGAILVPTIAQNANSVTQAIHFIKLANTLREVDKSQESISLIRRAMPTVQGKSLYWEAVANELLGLSYKDLSDTTQALSYLVKARTQYTKLKYVASGWAVNEVIRDISAKNVYAGIQINPSGVRVAIFKTKYESEFYEKDIRNTFDIPNNFLTADASNSFKGSQDALRVGLDSIRRYQIPNERIFVVFSSDIGDGLAQTPEARQTLYSQLSKVLPGDAVRIDTTFTSTREAELFTIGAIPRKVWPSTSALNLGSTSTTGGYFDQEASRRNFNNVDKSFHEVAVNIGINTLVSRIDGKRSLSTEAFKREAQRVIKAVADSALASISGSRNAGLQQRRTVGVGGDVVQALVAYLHPERANITAVLISMSDVEQFKRLALNDYKSLTQPNLKTIDNSIIRNQAEKDVDAVQKQLNEKQLITGALWLEAIANAYNAGSSPKRFVFIRNANLGWVTGKFLETINFEYESTIARGGIYIR